MTDNYSKADRRLTGWQAMLVVVLGGILAATLIVASLPKYLEIILGGVAYVMIIGGIVVALLSWAKAARRSR